MELRSLTPKKKITYLTLSDIHMLHKQNETSYIADSLFHYFDGFKSTSRFVDLDIIFLAGDIFDFYADSRSMNVVITLVWMRSLMEFCVKHDIKLRVLYGTPGHDFQQSRLFEPIAKAFGDKLDYKYFESLDIEIMEDLGMSILYVPDEWKGSAEIAKQDVIDKMKEYGLKSITAACMHGMFDFQIPELPSTHPLKHDSAWYLSIIDTFINIGHDHNPKIQDRILIQGSFERLAHGEEGPKGAILCTLDPVLGNSFEFIENKRARIFKTFKIRTKDLDKAVQQVKDGLVGIPDNAHIRISTTPDNPIMSVIEEFKRAYPGMNFKKHKDDKQVAKENGSKLQETTDLKSEYVTVALTADNIVGLIIESMNLEADTDGKKLLTSELESIRNAIS